MNYKEIMNSFERYVREESPRVQSPEEMAALLRPVFHNLRQEELHVLLMNAKNEVVKDVMATRGLVDRAQAHAREVFREAIVANASRVVLAHNHPSGDPTPSSQDISLTRELVKAGRIIGIEVMDHIIVGARTERRQKDFLSFREEGLIG